MPRPANLFSLCVSPCSLWFKNIFGARKSIMVIQERFYTAEDLWELSHLPENADKRFELSEGRLIEMSPTGGKHGGITLRFGARIDTHVEAKQLGYTTGAETGFILHKNPDGKDVARAPDVGFVAAARLPDGLPDEYVPLAPDLAVEVVSPNDKAAELQTKIGEYLKYGTKIVVAVYSKTQTIVVHTKEGATTLTIDDTFDGGDVLPGFSLPVREIFSQ
jgi:Uma2 family endonuclease